MAQGPQILEAPKFLQPSSMFNLGFVSPGPVASRSWSLDQASPASRPLVVSIGFLKKNQD
jgi:hypothetical protein